MMDSATARSAIAMASMGFGAWGVVAPRSLVKGYGGPELTPEHVHAVRIFAAATAALGIVGVLTDGVDDETFLKVAIGVNAIDALSGVTTSSTPRFRAMTALTSLTLGGIAAAGLADD